MSLIHWWPLNEDLQDKINCNTLTNTNATVDNFGKIGKCYYFNGSANVKTEYNSNKHLLGSSPEAFSIAFWIKLDSTWNGWGQVFTIGKEGASWNDIRIGIDIDANKIAYFSISNGSTSVSTNGPCQQLATEQWYHITAVYDKKKMSLYTNGAPAAGRASITTEITPLLSDATIIAIGGNSSEKGECYINDVRIYDHALSQAEVKELSKALVCHYKLDACNNTNLLLNSGNPSFNGYISKSNGSIVYDNILKTNVFECSNTATSEKFVFYSNRFPIIGGEAYTFSCDVYCNNYLTNMDVYLLSSSTLAVTSTATAFDNPNGIKYFNRSKTSTSEKLIPGQWVHISGTLTPSSGQTTAYIRIDNNGTSSSGTAAILRVANCKLERGTTSAPFGVHLNESLYATSEPDCSGFGNDATKYGVLTYCSDSAIGGNCTVFPGTAGNYINCGKGGKVRDAITVNWWGYMDNWSEYGRAISCTDGGGWNFEP